MIELGVFTVESHELIISDPCYSLGTWCAAEVGRVLVGEWGAYLEKKDEGDWGNRCAKITAIHSDYSTTGQWRKLNQTLGVDSGQCGIFDKKYYKCDGVIQKKSGYRITPNLNESGDLWYSACCEATLGKTGAGVIPFGAVSSSGLGDGAYPGYIKKNSEGKVVGVKVIFL